MIGIEAVLVPLAPVDPAPVGGVGVRGSVLDRPGRPVVLLDDVHVLPSGTWSEDGPHQVLADPYGGAPDGVVDAAGLAFEAGRVATRALRSPVLVVWLCGGVGGWLLTDRRGVVDAHVWWPDWRDYEIEPVRGQAASVAAAAGLPVDSVLTRLDAPFAPGETARDRAAALLRVLDVPPVVLGTEELAGPPAAAAAGLRLRPLAETAASRFPGSYRAVNAVLAPILLIGVLVQVLRWQDGGSDWRLVLAGLLVLAGVLAGRIAVTGRGLAR